MDFVVKGIFDSMTLSDLIGTAKGNPVTEVSTILPLAAIAALIVLQILNGYGGKADKTPRSLPPGDMSPAQAGYILTGICGETDITGLLFTLLAHGCLRVDRTGKKQLRFTACREPGPELGRHAAMYYEALFGRRQPGETVSLAEAQKDIGKAYDKIYFDLTGDYKNQHKLYTDRSAAFSKISYLICFGTCLAFMLRRFLTMSSEPGVKDVAMSILISLVFAAIPMFFLWIVAVRISDYHAFLRRQCHCLFLFRPYRRFTADGYCLAAIFRGDSGSAGTWQAAYRIWHEGLR